MAKRKKKKEVKKKFEHWTEIIGLILMIVSILSIVPSPMGIIGQIGASFAMFLIGTGYQILLLGCLVLGFYLVYKRDWPDFFTTRFIGLYLLAVGLIVLLHIDFIKVHSKDVMVVFEETVNNLLANFSNSLSNSSLTLKGSGIIGALFGVAFYKLFSIEGTYIVSIVLILLGIVFLTGIDLIGIMLKPFKRKKKKKKLSLEDTGVIVNDSSVTQFLNKQLLL